VPTTEQKDAATASIESLLSGSFRPEGAWTRPSDGVDSVPWDALTDEQKYDVLSASVDWQGFDAGQIVDVSRRVVEGESVDFWFDDIPVSDRAERRVDLFEEWRQDEQAARVRDAGLAPANDNEPAWRSEFNGMMRDIANPPRLESDYEKAIQRAAESAAVQQPHKGKEGPDR
jgi:hypothetical protein